MTNNSSTSICNFKIFLNYIFLLNFFNLIFLKTFKGFSGFIFFNNLFISNNVMFLLKFFSIFMFLILFIIYNSHVNNLFNNLDYYFCFYNVFFISTYIYTSSNILSFIFFLELISISIFLKFVFNKTFNNDLKDNKLNLTKKTNSNDMLFFQY